MPKTATASEVLAFWFEEAKPEQWYKKDPAFDEAIRDRRRRGQSPTRRARRP